MNSVSEFVKTFAEALVIVLVVSFLSLGWRTGIVVALSVPLVLAIVLLVMYATGLDLHRITLGALIIALGLLVDDAIIAIEMMVVKMEQGWDRARAATFAWTSTAFPMLTGTLVTAAGFLPVGFAKSSAGEYAGGIFWIVGLALIASWVVAVLFTPYLGLKLLPDLAKHGAHENPDAIYDTRVYRALRRVIELCLRWRKTVVAAHGADVRRIGRGLRPGPAAVLPDLDALRAVLRDAAAGRHRHRRDRRHRQEGRAAARRRPGHRDLYHLCRARARRASGSGSTRCCRTRTSPRSSSSPRTSRRASASRRGSRQAIADGALPEARSRVDRFVFGPPVGFPVQFRVVGPDPMKVRAIAEEVRQVMAANPKIVDPHLDWSEQVKSIRLEVDQDRARALGLTPQDVAQTLQTLLVGLDRHAISRRHRADRRGRARGSLRAARARPPAGADRRHPQRRRRAAVADRAAQLRIRGADPVAAQPRHRADRARRHRRPRAGAGRQQGGRAEAARAIKDALPYGYRIETGGSIEESVKANGALVAVFPVMAIVMLAFLMIQLQSFSRLALVFVTAPLGLIGATGALLVSNRPFGFVALLGLIALAGMIMRNTVILVDQIDRDIAAGHGRHRAIIGATVRRARPVVLTALAAILGMIPLAGSIFWGPMAITIMGGLFVATVLTLLVVPALYSLWFRVRSDETVDVAGHSPGAGAILRPRDGADPASPRNDATCRPACGPGGQPSK